MVLLWFLVSRQQYSVVASLISIHSKPNSGPWAAENLAGCFRLSKKYDVPAITEKLQTVFDNAWPDSLAEWIALEKSRVKELNDLHLQLDWEIIDVNDVWPDPSKTLFPFLDDILSLTFVEGPVVRLARETRTLTFLRAALYGLCRANITTPFSGYPDMFSEAYGAHESILRTSPDDLDLIDIGLLTVGRERIQNRTSHLLTTHIPQVITEHCSVENMDARGPRCDLNETLTGQIVCSGPLQRWVHERMTQGSRELMFDPIWELTRMQEEIAGFGPLPTKEVVCPACRRWFGKHLEHQTQLFWDWLPEAFDFDKLGFE